MSFFKIKTLRALGLINLGNIKITQKLTGLLVGLLIGFMIIGAAYYQVLNTQRSASAVLS